MAHGMSPEDLAAAERGTRRARAAVFVLGAVLVAAAVAAWLSVRW